MSECCCNEARRGVEAQESIEVPGVRGLYSGSHI